MLNVMLALTVTGQSTLAVVSPAFAHTSHRVGTLISSAYQYQPLRFLLKGSNGELAMIPCLAGATPVTIVAWRSEEHTSELQSPCNLVCRLLLEKKKRNESDACTTR